MKRFRALLEAARRRTRSEKPSLISIDDPTMRVVVMAFDDSEAASAALDRADQWLSAIPAVLRHHLVLPEHRMADAESLLGAEGWTLRPGGRGDQAEGTPMIALRVRHLDALHCAQESARMAGFAQRMGGRALGWDALQPEPGHHR